MIITHVATPVSGATVPDSITDSIWPHPLALSLTLFVFEFNFRWIRQDIKMLFALLCSGFKDLQKELSSLVTFSHEFVQLVCF